MSKRNLLHNLTIALLATSLTLPAAAVAGDYAKKPATTIVETAAGNPNFSTLVTAVKAADLVGTLSGPGPFTVFAPTNAAFDALPQGTVPTLLKPENKAKLTKVLTYHVVAGKVKAADLIAAINAHNGKYTITTVSGDTMVASLSGGKVLLTDESGGVATVTTTDLSQKNGVIHVIDKVVLPK